MRSSWIVVLMLMTACDFEAAPRPQPQQRAPVPVAPVVAVVPAGSGSAMNDVKVPVTSDCVTVADHLVGLSIAAIKSPQEQAIQTANRARLVRDTAKSCTEGKWTPEVITCFIAATTPPQLAACNKLVEALPPAPRAVRPVHVVR